MAAVIVWLDSARFRRTFGKKGICGLIPMAIVTAIVSPMARDIARTYEATIPEVAAGTTTFVETSYFVDPSP
jgi:hypothetical protein